MHALRDLSTDRRRAVALWFSSLTLGCGGVEEARPFACDPLDDTGCPAGEHCRLNSARGALCLAPTSAPAGVPCGTGSCAPSETCARVEGHLACRPLCDLDEGTGCTGEARCAYALTDRFGVCVGPCDPFPGGSEPCPGGTCSPVRDLPFPVCVATGPARLGDDCTFERCARSLACLAAGDGARCRPLCEPGRDDLCPAPMRCGGEVSAAALGYCTAPSP